MNEEINLLNARYNMIGGTLMFNKDKISLEQLSNYMREYRTNTSELVYYNVRDVNPNNSIHLDFLFLIDKSKASTIDEKKQLVSKYLDDSLLDGLYRLGGNILKGKDYNAGDIRDLFINSKFFINKK